MLRTIAIAAVLGAILTSSAVADPWKDGPGKGRKHEEKYWKERDKEWEKARERAEKAQEKERKQHEKYWEEQRKAEERAARRWEREYDDDEPYYTPRVYRHYPPRYEHQYYTPRYHGYSEESLRYYGSDDYDDRYGVEHFHVAPRYEMDDRYHYAPSRGAVKGSRIGALIGELIGGPEGAAIGADIGGEIGDEVDR